MENPPKGSVEFYLTILRNDEELFDLEYLEKINSYFNLKPNNKEAIERRITELKSKPNG